LKQALNTGDVFRNFKEARRGTLQQILLLQRSTEISKNRGEKIPIPIMGSRK
jgi:hypothetical protein